MFVEFTPPDAASATRALRIWRASDMLLGVGMLVLSVIAVTAALVVLGVTPGAPGNTSDNMAAAVATIALELLFGGAVLWLAARRGLGWADLGFVRPRRWGPVGIAWAGSYVVIVAYQLLLAAVKSVGVDVSMFDDANALPVDPRESVVLLLLLGTAVVVVAPFCEELFFRALLFRGMRGYWRLAPSLAVSGLAFGAFHLNPSVVLPFALIGVLFAWANEQSGSLWTSIAAHAGVNGVSFALSLVVEV